MCPPYLIELFIIFISYLIGSLSSAIIICKMTGAPDPRTAGSLNPGATNVLRVGGKSRAITVLIGDTLKGFIAVIMASYFSEWVVACAFLAVFLGHLFPIFFNFKGGKGVATALGGLLGLAWPIGLIVLGIWLMIVILTRYSSLAAIIAAISAPLITWGWLDSFNASTVFLISTMLLYRHKENFKRLLHGTEPKIGLKR